MYLPGRSQLESRFGEGWGNIGENTPSLQTSVSLLENGDPGADLTWLLQGRPKLTYRNMLPECWAQFRWPVCFSSISFLLVSPAAETVA